MQNILKITGLTLFTLFIYSSMNGQSIESYIMNMPKTTLDGGGKIYVKDLTNLGEEGASFGSNFSAHVKETMNSTNRGGGVNKLYNPWLTTKLYDIVDSEENADYIIQGDYKITSAESKSYNEKWIKETSTTVNKVLPICYYEFSASSKATIGGKMIVVKKGSEAVVVSFPINDSKTESKTQALNKPAVNSASSLVGAITYSAISKNKGVFSPTLVSTKYKFGRVSSKDKILKKEFKGKHKSVNALAKAGDIKSIAAIYLEMLSKEVSEDANSNLAQCYELIGNYTKAKELYIKANDKRGIRQISGMIIVRDSMKGLGIDIVENDFIK